MYFKNSKFSRLLIRVRKGCLLDSLDTFAYPIKHLKGILRYFGHFGVLIVISTTQSEFLGT